MKWEFVYEQEFPDSNGYCCLGIISNGKHFLFFNVCADEPGSKEICRVYNSIDFDEQTIECEYEWTSENDSILLECLNSVGDTDYCGAGSPIQTLKFITSHKT